MSGVTSACRTGLLAALLLATVACAQEPSAPSATAGVSQEALRPFVGTWRPTSAAEERNIESITISTKEISVAAEKRQVLKFTLERQTDEGVILRVTGKSPGDQSSTRALALSLDTKTAAGAQSGTKDSRQFIWIYWCSRLEQLSGQLDKSACSKNGYFR